MKSTSQLIACALTGTILPAFADWSTRPPAVTELKAEPLIGIANAGSARVLVRFAESGLPEVIPLHLDKTERVLRDDGTGADAMAADGVYSAIIPFDAQGLEVLTANTAKKRELLDANQQFTRSRFEGRHRVEDVPVPPFDSASWKKGLAVPLAAFRSTGNADMMWERSLMIIHANVVNNDRAAGTGKWSFGYLFTELARKHRVDPRELARRWLAHWELPQPVNGFSVPERSNVSGLINRWKTSGFDPAHAPFRLLAIVHRIDLRHDILLGGPGSAGENRFVYCAVDESGNPLQFTVIFEYGIQVSTAEEVKQEAVKWAALQTWGPGEDAFNNHLEILTEETVRIAGSTHCRLDQLRTNENALDPLWQLREFKLFSGPDDAGFLRQTTTKQTPDNSLGGNDRLTEWVTGNAADVLDHRHNLPATLPPANMGGDFARILGGGANEDGIVWLTGKGLPALVRHRFALNTCNGCHQAETGTEFTHIKPRGAAASGLSGFMTGITVSDPGGGGFQRHHDEKTRRADDFEMLLTFPAIFQLRHRPMLMEH